MKMLSLFTYCVQLFEEMTAVWCEEIRESRRRLCAKLGTENPRLEDFKLVALSQVPQVKLISSSLEFGIWLIQPGTTNG